jgi:hypothetical protein
MRTGFAQADGRARFNIPVENWHGRLPLKKERKATNEVTFRLAVARHQGIESRMYSSVETGLT